MLNGVIIGDKVGRNAVFTPDNLARYGKQVRWHRDGLTAEEVLDDPRILREVDVIFGTWGMPVLDGELLSHASRLKVVFYGAGSVRGFVTDEFWDRGIRITSAQAANAIPVAEVAVAQIIIGLKGLLHCNRVMMETRDWWAVREDFDVKGLYQSSVGLVSYGSIARLTRQLLRAFEIKVLVCDPYLGEAEAEREGVERVTLDEIFRRSDAVSVHTPALPETLRMIRGEHILSMPKGAVFINTARGAVVDQPSMLDALRKRSDIQAMIDVTDPEPPPADGEIFDLPNLLLTPHIAGSMGRERARLGAFMADELERFVSGSPLKWEITRESIQRMA